MSRRSRKKAKQLDKVTGFALALLGAALILVLVLTAWYVRQRPTLDPVTNCPPSGPTAVHLLLFDRSDPVSGLQAQRIRQEVDRLKATAAPGTRFDIYTFEGDTKNELQPLLRVCASGRPEDANDLIENRERIRKRYTERFSAVLDKTVDELLKASTRPSSPIIESLRAAAQTSFGPFDVGQVPLRVMLISDMVQHSEAVSHFRAEANFQSLSRGGVWPVLRPQLKGADVQILYLLRPSAVRAGAPIQNGSHQTFWEHLVEASGGRLMSIEPL
jgi:hypothetical protein